MKLETGKIEKKELEPVHNIIQVDFMRHGSTKYVENFTSDEEKINMAGEFPRDLTPEGEEEVRKEAEKIIKSIDPKNEVIVLWSSPAWRAQGSEAIIRDMLDERGIAVYRDSAISQMRNFDQHDKVYMNSVWERLAPISKTAESIYARDPEFQEKNEKFESLPEVRARAEQVFNWIRYLAERANLDGKKLHIIGVTHFEFLNPIMEDIFGFMVEDDEGVGKGENMTIKFDFDSESKGKELSITADFRGVHKEGIIFDPLKRKFSLK